jgi:histidine phosphatase superfamily protein (branch 1)
LVADLPIFTAVKRDECSSREIKDMKNELPAVYLARHGETTWSLTGQHTGLADLPMTERGDPRGKRSASGQHVKQASSKFRSTSAVYCARR